MSRYSRDQLNFMARKALAQRHTMKYQELVYRLSVQTGWSRGVVELKIKQLAN